MCFGGGGGDGGARQARADELARQARIKKGVGNINDSFSRFDDSFFDARKEAYRNFVTPQVNDQYKQVGDQLAYSLARSGLDQSSESARQQGVLMRDNALARQQIAEGATGEATKARQAVEDQRNSLISQVNMTNDAELASQNALRSASILQQQQAFNPIANLFSNTTGLLGAAQNAGYYSGGPGLKPFREFAGFGSPKTQGPTIVRS
jgi:hypothetical protein